MPRKAPPMTDAHKAKLLAAGSAGRARKNAVREGSRIEIGDLVMFKTDEWNWQVGRKDGTGDVAYFGEPTNAAIELLRRTTDHHLCRTKTRTIADLRACVESAKAEVVAAMKRVEGRLF